MGGVMRRRLAAWAVAGLCAGWAGAGARAGDDVVVKCAETFDSPTWKLNPWSKAGGGARLVEGDAPEGVPENDSVAITAKFSGKGFEWWSVDAPVPLVIPGKLQKISLWAKGGENAEHQGIALNFHDAYGRSEVDGRKFVFELGRLAKDWREYTFTVPNDWVAPVKIVGFGTHNWESQGVRRDVVWQFGRLTVTTDMAGVDPETGFPPGFVPNAAADKPENRQPDPIALFSMDLGTNEVCNVFAGDVPTLRVVARSWLKDVQDVDVDVKIASMSDASVAPVAVPRQKLRINDTQTLVIPHQPERFGVYSFTAEASRADGWKKTFTSRFAYLPRPRELTDAQRDASPYGLNVHGGRAAYVTPFSKAGVTWFRDYVFGLGTLANSKGAAHTYDGWPGHRKLVAAYEAEKIRLLVCLQGAMQDITLDQIRAGATPNRAWTDEVIDALQGFPQLPAWEIDNEYELHAGRAEAERQGGWKTYGNYHRVFGELVRVVSHKKALAVENGRAGIAPDVVRGLVASGDFDDIDVVNSHYYCGVEAPEANYANWNFHQDADELRQAACLLYDQLREAKAAGQSDGRLRQHWLTEFGWDTKAGNVVSHATQAAYLPRAYMLLLASGAEKGFWFFDVDSADANNFFDGCGLLAEPPDHLPKPVLAAMAGMTQLMPSPEYVGMTFAGAGTWGYVFRQDGQYVVSLWTVDDVADGPEVEIPAEAAYDLCANRLAGAKHRLGQAPTYWVGVSADSPFVRQARFGIDSRMLVLACAGDTFDIDLSVNPLPGVPMPKALSASMDLPAGWTLQDIKALEPAGDDGRLKAVATVKVDPNATLADLAFTLTLKDGADTVAAIPFRVLVQPALSLSVNALGRDPGAETLTATVINRAKRTVKGTLRLVLPDGWTAPRMEIPFDALDAGQTREVPVPLTWTAEGVGAATAAVGDEAGGAALVLEAEDGSRIRKPLIPGRIAVARGDNLPLDGDPAAWPAATRVPGWIFGATQSEPQADVWMAWAPEGLYVGLDVKDSVLRVQTPQTFWVGDSFELFLDLTGRDDDTFVKGRHQFWVVPQPERDGKVYVGRWKRGTEIAETAQDVAVRGKSVRKGDGYALTLLFPAAALDDWAPKAGDALGLNLNLAVRGRQFDREVFWPVSKAKDAPGKPTLWGRATLR